MHISDGNTVLVSTTTAGAFSANIQHRLNTLINHLASCISWFHWFITFAPTIDHLMTPNHHINQMNLPWRHMEGAGSRRCPIVRYSKGRTLRTNARWP